MNLAIDIGNTLIKAALFDRHHLKELFLGVEETHLPALIAETAAEHVVISSVRNTLPDIQQGARTLVLTHNIPVPFDSAYATPHTLGLDRIAAVAGGQGLFPNKNLLIIDLGTCITYDLLLEGQYQGGGISPGVSMRFKALHTFTGNLPLEKFTDDIPLVGTTTTACIQSGVVYGVRAEIEQIIRMYCDKYRDLQIIMCGGDAKLFENKLKASIFAAPELVLRGLNRILLYNVDQQTL